MPRRVQGTSDTLVRTRIISTPIHWRARLRLVPKPISCSARSIRKARPTSVLSYLCCRLTRFLILLRQAIPARNAQGLHLRAHSDWTKRWTDGELYKKYGLTASEIAFIEWNGAPDGNQRRLVR